MYACEDHEGWTMQVTAIPHNGMFTAIAVIDRDGSEFRFEHVGMCSTEASAIANAIRWLRDWIILNRLSGSRK